MRHVIFFVGFLLAVGLCEVREYSCDLDEVNMCMSDLIAFERTYFPFYGGSKTELDETCRAMNETLGCLEYFADNCGKMPNCNDTCKRTVDGVSQLVNASGVFNLYDHLCTDEHHPVRETYMENYECFEKASDKYTMCHNMSIESLHLQQTVRMDPKQRIELVCCFFSWYKDCYTNATVETCGVNATFFVSFALHTLLDSAVTRRCDPMISCDKPPLPQHNMIPESEDTNPESDDTKAGSGASHPTTNFVVLLVFVHFAYFLVRNKQ